MATAKSSASNTAAAASTTSTSMVVGAGATNSSMVKADRNDEGLTYASWLKKAGVSNTQKAHQAWRSGANPISFTVKPVGGSKAMAASNPSGGIGGFWAGLSTPTKVAIGVAAGAAAIGGVAAIVYYVKSRQAPSWKRVTVIPAGRVARISIDTTALKAALGGIVNDAAITAWLTSGRMLTNATVWGAGDAALPSDWPKDDVGALNVHAQFRNGGPTDLNVAAFVVPTAAWILG